MNKFLRDFVWPLIKRLIKLICVGPVTLVAPWVFGFAFFSLKDLLLGRTEGPGFVVTWILGAIGLVALYSSILLPRGFLVLSRAYRVACLCGLAAGMIATIVIVTYGPMPPIDELLSPGLWFLGGPFAVAIYQIVEILKTAEPSATDNPDGAQRLREDQ